MPQFRATKKYGSDWLLYTDDAKGQNWSTDQIQIILLQEIRDELQRLNSLLHCQNCTNLPRDLRSIKREVATIRRRLEGRTEEAKK